MRRKWRTPSDSEPEGREWANGDPEEAALQWVKVNGVEGTNDAGTFVIDPVPVYAGTNMVDVLATDEDGQTTSVDAVVDLDPGDGSYGLPGGGKA